MPRPEISFASPETTQAAQRLGVAVRQARLARNITRLDFSARARISPATLDRIEKGDVAVRLGAWLLALQTCDLLHLLKEISNPDADLLGAHARQQQVRKRASGKRGKVADDYDF